MDEKGKGKLGTGMKLFAGSLAGIASVGDPFSLCFALRERETKTVLISSLFGDRLL